MAKLTIMAGTSAGQTFQFNKHIRIGRSAENDLIIKKPTISSYHAEIVLRNQQPYLCDLGSTNGTALNGVPLHSHSYVRLNTGDEIGFADYKMRFESDDVIQSMARITGQFAVQSVREPQPAASQTIQICALCGKPRTGHPPRCACSPQPTQTSAPRAAEPVQTIESAVPSTAPSSVPPNAAVSASVNQELEAAERDEKHLWLWSGILMIVLSLLWLVVSLAMGVIFLYPLLMLSAGVYAVYKGVANNDFSRAKNSPQIG